MHYLHTVYEWKAYKLDGSVSYGPRLNKADLIFFELMPKAPGLPKIAVDLSGDRELIYFKRVFCRSDIVGQIYDIHYYVGYRENGEDYIQVIKPKEYI